MSKGTATSVLTRTEEESKDDESSQAGGLRKGKRKYVSRAKTEEQVESKTKNGRWIRDEHIRFLQALKYYGKNWKKVEEHVKTRTSTQARSHAQKFFANIQKNKMTMDEFLVRLDLANLGSIFS